VLLPALDVHDVTLSDHDAINDVKILDMTSRRRHDDAHGSLAVPLRSKHMLTFLLLVNLTATVLLMLGTALKAPNLP
jgi:hypothetical protein